MRRVLDLFREWLQIRTRVWEEHRFHLEQAEADWLALGLSRREACRAARRRFGARQSRREALRELGGNLPGLAHLFNAHQVSASAWLQPIALIAGAALLLVVSPDSRAVLEGIAGQPLTPNERAAVFISVQAPNRSYRGISSADFELMRSIPGLAGVQRYRAIHVRADIRPGFTVGAIQSRVRGITANAQIRVIPMFEQASLVIGPAASQNALGVALVPLWIVLSCPAFADIDDQLGHCDASLESRALANRRRRCPCISGRAFCLRGSGNDPVLVLVARSPSALSDLP